MIGLEAVTATGDRPAERWRRPVGNAAGRTFEVAVPTGDPWHDRGRPAKAHLPLTLARAVDAQKAAAGGALRRCIGFTGARFGRVESHSRTGAQVYGHNTAVDGLARGGYASADNGDANKKHFLHRLAGRADRANDEKANGAFVEDVIEVCRPAPEVLPGVPCTLQGERRRDLPRQRGHRRAHEAPRRSPRARGAGHGQALCKGRNRLHRM